MNQTMPSILVMAAGAAMAFGALPLLNTVAERQEAREIATDTAPDAATPGELTLAAIDQPGSGNGMVKVTSLTLPRDTVVTIQADCDCEFRINRSLEGTVLLSVTRSDLR